MVPLRFPTDMCTLLYLGWVELRGRAVHLLIEPFEVQSLHAKVSVGKILNPKWFSDVFIGLWLLYRKRLSFEQTACLNVQSSLSVRVEKCHIRLWLDEIVCKESAAPKTSYRFLWLPVVCHVCLQKLANCYLSGNKTVTQPGKWRNFTFKVKFMPSRRCQPDSKGASV